MEWTLAGDRKPYYEGIFTAHEDQSWDNAPGKNVLIKALDHKFGQGDLGNSEQLIDLGCGTGFFLNRIHSEVCDSWGLTGVDFAETAIKKGRGRHPDLSLHCQDASATDFPDGQFSVLTNYGSLEHFPNPREGVIESARLLRPGGLFLLMIPTLGVYRSDRDDEGWYEDLSGQPQWNFWRQTWESFFMEAGLVLDETAKAEQFGALKPGVFYFGRKLSESRE